MEGIGIIFIIAVVIYIIVNTENSRKAKIAQILADSVTSKKIKDQQSRIEELTERNTFLEKYQAIIDAEAEAARIIKEANAQAQLSIAKSSLAREQYETLTAASLALRNIIEGYGDDYIIPTFTLLDELAAEYSYKEAGVKLKEARDLTKKMAKSLMSAQCDFVTKDSNRTAKMLVTDAFNGRVDQILSDIKKDNFGTLKQKMLDVYHAINNISEILGNTKIRAEYYKSREKELYWGVICQELKYREQEEQRKLRDQIREEEKAAREFAKAMAQAEREESLIKKAIDKTHTEMLAANEADRIKYEQALSELQLKLEVAEEKSKKAISMAQQTKSGHVYVISNIGSFGDNVFKIGMTRRLDPRDRVHELGDASVPFGFDIHAMIYSENAPKLEFELHKHFVENQVNKVNVRKEFFKIELDAIKKKLESLGINALWTLRAEAIQYRETLKIEQQIKENSAVKEEWKNKQLIEEAIAVNEPEIMEDSVERYA